MNYRRKKDKPDKTPVDNAFIRGFLPLAPELALKAYIYGLMLAETGEPESIADALGAKDDDIRAAFAYLEAQGLVEIIDGDEQQIVFNRVGEFSSAAENREYSELIRSLQAVLGTRVLSGSELSKIYDWIDVFGFTKEAAVEIVRGCLDRKGARTSAAYMDKVAKTFAGKGAFTPEAVRKEWADEDAMQSGAARILKRWKQSRPATEDELALYEKWMKGWGIDEATLDYALSNMTSSSKPNFKYLDSIIEDLYRNGSIDEESIREKQKEDDLIRDLSLQALKRAGLRSNPDREKIEQFRVWYREYCLSAELIFLAADLSKEGAKPYASMKRVLEAWHNEGISSVSAARESWEKNGGYDRMPRRTGHSMNYMQGKKYSEEELKKLGISLGEEFYDDDDK